jgi:hypothetical protein
MDQRIVGVTVEATVLTQRAQASDALGVLLGQGPLTARCRPSL